MSASSPSSGPSAPMGRKIRKAFTRNKLRNATFVIPSTSQRVNRQITLRNPPAGLDGSDRRDSTDSFLPYERHFSSAGTLETTLHNTKLSLRLLWNWVCSPTGTNVLKCSVAYSLGCMGTLFPPLAAFLGHQDGKHVVATMCTYFHPGRSVGAMIEAVLYLLGAIAYAITISVSSMAVSVLCETQFDLIVLGYTVVLLVFIGGGLGFLGWIKQRLGNPLVNVACSLASLSIITVVTKENAVQTGVFSNNKIIQSLKMVLLTMIFTTSTNLLLWPIYARRELRKSMIQATNSLGDMLTTITHSFLSGSETELRSTEYQDLVKKYKTVFLLMTKNLREAKLEHYVMGREKQFELEARLVNSLQRLSQSIGGLRSAAMTQFTLLRESSDAGASTPMYATRHDLSTNGNDTTIRTKPDRAAVLAVIDEDPNEHSDFERTESHDDLGQSHTSFATGGNMPTIHTPSEIFSRFILQLGPSMKSLAYTLSQMLTELPFGEGPKFKIAINDNFRTSLTDALSLYSEARTDALEQLYRSKDVARERIQSIEADFEEVAASCGYFSFSLQDFAQEMQTYLEVLEELKLEMDLPKRRSWEWTRFWRQRGSTRRSSRRDRDSEESSLVEPANEHDAVDGEHGVTRDIPDPVRKRHNSIKVANENFSMHEAVSGVMMPVLRFLRRDDIRFALKVGIGATLWALLAFIPETRPFYAQFRGEWGLLSFMLVCSMTVGASNTTGYARFLGTFIGAVLASFAWVVSKGEAVVLLFCCWLVSLYCFYLIVAAGRAPFGRFTLLTFNLSALYAYSLSIKDDDNDEDEGGAHPVISEIAFHRVIAVLGGVIWGLIITRMIWPISARQKFRDGLSTLWLRMGLIWGRDPLAAVLNEDKSNAYMNFREELALQKYVTRLDVLRVSASAEFSIRGPFPAATHSRIMDSTNKMLDCFHSLNTVIKKDLRANAAERAILKYTEKERKDLCDRISHLFQVLASSMKLEFPVSSAVGSMINARDRLLAKVWKFRKLHAPSSSSAHSTAGYSIESSTSGLSESVKADGPSSKAVEDDTDLSEIEDVNPKDEDFALLYAYALVTGQLADEIRRVEREIVGLFGAVDEELLELF